MAFQLPIIEYASEQHGVDYLRDDDLLVYSPGISTAGVAEIKIAQLNPKRQVIATTIDQLGSVQTQEIMAQAGFSNQITVKFEDICQPLPYADNFFDFVYARLILHYLSRQSLDRSLVEICRVLRPKGHIYAVVRSTQDPDTRIPGTTFDTETCLTSYPFLNKNGQIEKDKIIKRYFHTQRSISTHLFNAGFTINHIDQYTEQLFFDFARQQPNPSIHNLIEVLATKS